MLALLKKDNFATENIQRRHTLRANQENECDLYILECTFRGRKVYAKLNLDANFTAQWGCKSPVEQNLTCQEALATNVIKEERLDCEKTPQQFYSRIAPRA